MKQFIKIFISIVIILVGLTLPTKSLAASTTAKVYVNTDRIQFDVNPIINNGVTLVEFRSLFEALNISFEYISSSKIIKAQKGNLKVQLQIGSKTAYINGNKVTLDVAAKTVNGRTMIPLRFVGESTGSTVMWHGNVNEIDIYSSDYSGQKRVVSAGKMALRGMEWDMSVNEVMKKETAEFMYSDREFGQSILAYSLTKYNQDTVLYYYFENDALVAAMYDFIPYETLYHSWNEMESIHDFFHFQASAELGTGFYSTDDWNNIWTTWDQPTRNVILTVDDEDYYTSATLTFLKP
ncbi:copper amine oxidase N-terminal domain-containing protein [Mangrovibacillus cuniculi]|uniref:Copper amine oxidase N-terminal domain-containing protein n=1 Tax=Mangrovibacillus cuniculi TaxID=2593652 RepID=A0A7S8CCT6_9BACI|nr:copper amine oxidase N-terminal domain-containing protein [Mangrovibacillus cuniculi]QPC47547.1 copper amine oxidase N-terminal domain-containing protein [Mangrovibacillus cuniculi]